MRRCLIIIILTILTFIQCDYKPSNQKNTTITNQSEALEPEDFSEEKPVLDTKKYKTYTVSGLGTFTIAYPKKWQVLEKPTAKVSVVMIEAENGDQFRNNLNIIVTLRGVKLSSAFTDDSERQMKQVFPDYKILSKEMTKLRGKNCLRLLTSCTMEGYPVIQDQYIFKKENIGYLMSFTISKDRYEQEKNTIKDIINSITFN